MRNVPPHSAGLGAGLPRASGIVGSAGGTAAEILALAPATGPAAPFVAAAAAVIALFTAFFGGGCGQACIDGAKVEQIYEAAAENILAVGKLGMIGRSAVLSALQLLTQAGQQHEAQLLNRTGREDPHASAGAANLVRVIGELEAEADQLSETPTRALDLSAARGAYVSGSGWYSDSLSAAAQWTDTYLSSIGPSLSVGGSGLSIGAASGSWSPLVWIAGLGLVGWALWSSYE